jgi:hypothetical protein
MWGDCVEWVTVGGLLWTWRWTCCWLYKMGAVAWVYRLLLASQGRQLHKVRYVQFVAHNFRIFVVLVIGDWHVVFRDNVLEVCSIAVSKAVVELGTRFFELSYRNALSKAVVELGTRFFKLSYRNTLSKAVVELGTRYFNLTYRNALSKAVVELGTRYFNLTYRNALSKAVLEIGTRFFNLTYRNAYTAALAMFYTLRKFPLTKVVAFSKMCHRISFQGYHSDRYSDFCS